MSTFEKKKNFSRFYLKRMLLVDMQFQTAIKTGLMAFDFTKST